MKQEKYGYIYKITNNINGKIYVGQHKSNTLDETYWSSGVLIKQAINKEGINNFSREILEWCDSKERLNQQEIYWIFKLDSINLDIGYNLTKGGDGTPGVKLSNETKVKMSHAKTGKKHSQESIEKMRETIMKNGGRKGSNNGHYGKRFTQEQKQHFSEIYKNSQGVKNSSRFKGHSHSEESKRKISESVKKRRFKINCKICGEPFEAKSNRSLYCDSCKSHKSKRGESCDFKR